MRQQFERGAPGDDLAHIERQRLKIVVRLPDFAGERRIVVELGGLPMMVTFGEHHISTMPGTRTMCGCSAPAFVSRLTWAMTMPPEFRAACAIASMSCVTVSCSAVRLPRVSAVVAE